MPTFNTTDPKPGYIYDSSDDTWYPLAGIAVQSLDGLTDVVISSAASGQTLVYNGTNWVNTAETGDVSAVSAGTGITVTNGTGPVPSVAIDSTVATLTDTQTLTNKTLTTPTINGGTITATGGTVVIHGILLPATHGISFEGTTDDLNETVLVATDPTEDRTVSLPDATTTLVGRDTTDTLTNKTITSALEQYPVLIAPEERWNIAALSAGSSVNLDVLTSAVWYYTSSSSSNWTLNVRGGASTSLNDLLTTGDSITTVFFATNGTTPFYQTALLVDGATSGVSVKWQNGVAPSAGNTSSIDIYSFTIVKTGSAAFTAFGSQTKFS